MEYPISKVKLASHRNGVAGTGFYVALFNQRVGKGKSQKMVGIVFPDKGNVAIFDIGKLVKGDIKFASNSWRGDAFEPELREAIKIYESKL